MSAWAIQTPYSTLASEYVNILKPILHLPAQNVAQKPSANRPNLHTSRLFTVGVNVCVCSSMFVLFLHLACSRTSTRATGALSEAGCLDRNSKSSRRCSTSEGMCLVKLRASPWASGIQEDQMKSFSKSTFWRLSMYINQLRDYITLGAVINDSERSNVLPSSHAIFESRFQRQPRSEAKHRKANKYNVPTDQKARHPETMLDPPINVTTIAFNVQNDQEALPPNGLEAPVCGRNVSLDSSAERRFDQRFFKFVPFSSDLCLELGLAQLSSDRARNKNTFILPQKWESTQHPRGITV